MKMSACRPVWFVCGWQVKGPSISERFRDKELIYKALYKFSCLDLLCFAVRAVCANSVINVI